MKALRRIFGKKPTTTTPGLIYSGPRHTNTMKALPEAPKTRRQKLKDRIEGLSTGKKIGGGVGLGVVLGLGGSAVTGLASRNKSKLGPTKQHGAANVGAHFYNTAPRSRKV